MILNGMAPTLRPMTRADVDAATELILGNDWGVRREWLEFAATQPACIPIVAEAHGEIVGTGVGTVSGPVGWIGTIFIAPGRRGHGLGRAITQTIIERLESAGCRSLVLVATNEGRRLYERMGFEVQTHRHTGPVWGYTVSGGWKYKEYDYVNRAGSFLYEPAGSVHTLQCIEDNTQVWFHMYGVNLNLDADGNVESVSDGAGSLKAYYAMCEAQGIPRPNVLVG